MQLFHEIVSGQRCGIAATVARGVLRGVEPVVGAGVRWRNRRFDRGLRAIHQAAVPVISVGNLTLGGTGKTPVVAWLAKRLRQLGYRPGVISRGYGRRSPAELNDEGLELRQRLPETPHVQDPDRVAAADRIVREHHVDIILADDAFQHRRLARDLDMVVIDATRPFGFDHLFPRGLLREPKQNLRRADMVVLSRSNLVDDVARAQLRRQVQSLAPHVIWVECEQHPGALVDAKGQVWSNEKIPPGDLLAFCGIGNPEGFRQLLNASTDSTLGGRRVVELLSLPDHCPYDEPQLCQLADWSQKRAEAQQIGAVVCTAKDLVKLSPQRLLAAAEAGRRPFRFPVPLLAMQLELRFSSGLQSLELRLRATLDEWRKAA